MSGSEASASPQPEDRGAAPAHVAPIVSDLERALQRDLRARVFAPEADWSLMSVAARTFRETVPVVSFRRGDTTLCFIVTPRDDGARSYRKTRHYDLTYFSEDVHDDEQARIYQRDRSMIDAFLGWLSAAEGDGGRFP